MNHRHPAMPFKSPLGRIKQPAHGAQMEAHKACPAGHPRVDPSGSSVARHADGNPGAGRERHGLCFLPMHIARQDTAAGMPVVSDLAMQDKAAGVMKEDDASRLQIGAIQGDDRHDIPVADDRVHAVAMNACGHRLAGLQKCGNEGSVFFYGARDGFDEGCFFHSAWAA